MSPVLITGAILLATLFLTYVAAGRNKSARSHYVAGGEIKSWVNSLAITGDYVSAAAFLGLTGAIALGGFSGYYLMMGIPIAFVVVLLVVAEPMRNLGQYTVADMIASRFGTRQVRSVVALNTVIISVFYMVAQFAGAGALAQLLLGVPYTVGVVVAGVLMTIYIVAGGMLATTWIQAFQGLLLLAGTVVLTLLVFANFDFNPLAVFDEAVAALGTEAITPQQAPGIAAGLDVISLQIALLLGTAALPHVLIRFLTVPDAKAARSSAIGASFMIGIFFLMIPVLGYGAAVVVGRDAIEAADPAGNLAAAQLAQILGGDLLFGFIVAVALSIILATLAGLVIAASGAFAHDFYSSVLRGGQLTQREQFVAARIAGGAIPLIAITLALGVQGVNLAVLITLIFATAASANLPAILLAIFWRNFNLAGAVTGMLAGLFCAVALVLVGPTVMGEASIFPLENPALVSVPVGFLASYVGTKISGGSRGDATSYDELYLRANIGSPDGEPRSPET